MTINNTFTTEQETLLNNIYQNTDVDLEWLMTNEKPETMDELREKVDIAISEIEVIYYGNAMEYLREHDVSLTESLTLAHEYGFTADKINSELLATLLQQEQAREEMENYYEDLEKLFY